MWKCVIYSCGVRWASPCPQLLQPHISPSRPPKTTSPSIKANLSNNSMSEQTGKFIVVFKDSATKEEIEQYAEKVNNNGGEVTNRYDGVLNGFAAKLTPQLASSFQGDSIIDYIEPDGIVTTQ
ncbi:uncharacterized protein EI90DRAFT_3032186 [Cantharellus anzutake]|uniref:uncharacterized protein n=1 Tax=Cantharellus anzutake TaxID=1750568 RepID=UPI001907444C|nr:uncharacterized protein EI90DRAFT_3032186 [Cantharellus anzutake]KAF8342120.1 hypothetical protein EI90DRAFT_3032186 [Cantharellus anzutake]